MTLALAAAIGGALAYGTGSVLQAAGARRAATRGHGVLGVAVQVPYLAGLGCDLLGWLLSLLALRRLPLFAVQAILAGSVAVTVLLAALTIGSALRREDLGLIGATVAALVVLGFAAGAENPRPVHSGVRMALLIGVPVVAGTAIAVARWASPVATGALGGLAFSGAALSARALHTKSDLAGIIAEPLAVAVVAYGLIGMLAYAHALERGDVGSVTAALWVIEIIVAGVIGVLALGDHVRSGWALPAVLASGVAVAATVALARSAAHVTIAPPAGTTTGDSESPRACT